MNIVGYTDKNAFDIELEDVLFFEAFGDDVYGKTMSNQFLVKFKLYDTVEFERYGFIRINKSIVVNIYKIITLTPQVNSRIKIRLKNQEVFYINRSYLKSFKAYLQKGEYKNG